MTLLQIIYQLSVLLTGVMALVTAIVAIRKKHKPNATDVLVKSGDQAVTTLQRVITSIEADNIRLTKRLDFVVLELDERDARIRQLELLLSECQKKIGERCDRLRSDVNEIKGGRT